MATPGFTLTADLQDLIGAEAGSVANPARLRITLCNYGLTPPVIAGTSVLAQIVYEAVSTGSPLSIVLYGNDQISPGATYYAIETLDGRGRTVQTAAYQLTGAGGNLSTLIPITPTPPAGTPSTYFNLGGDLSNQPVTHGPGAGAGATAQLLGTDGNFLISLNTGSSPATDDVVLSFPFTQSRGHVTYPVIQFVSTFATPPTPPSVSPSITSATTFQMKVNGTLAANSNYTWNVICP